VPAIQSYFIEPVWEQFCALLPQREVNHPLGCHRSRVPDQVVFSKLVQVLNRYPSAVPMVRGARQPFRIRAMLTQVTL
jgi:hypothetical protein